PAVDVTGTVEPALFTVAASSRVRIGATHVRPPQLLTGLHVERHDRVVGVRVRRDDVDVAGADIDRVALDVDRRGIPDPGARRAIEHRARRILPADRSGSFRERAGLPDLLSGCCLERDDAALERAALVSQVGCRYFFPGGD